MSGYSPTEMLPPEDLSVFTSFAPPLTLTLAPEDASASTLSVAKAEMLAPDDASALRDLHLRSRALSDAPDEAWLRSAPHTPETDSEAPLETSALKLGASTPLADADEPDEASTPSSLGAET